MSSPHKRHTRPRKPLYDVIVTRWLTLTHFAWFLAAVLALVLGVLAVKSADRLGRKGEYPYTLVAMTATHLDMHLRDMRAKGAVVMLYDANCGDCGKQINSLLNLRALQGGGELDIIILSLDDAPETAMRYLDSINLPESMVTYYAGTTERAAIGRTLERIGSTRVTFSYPHTLLVGKGRKVITEYKGYIRSQEIIRTLRLHSMKMP